MKRVLMTGAAGDVGGRLRKLLKPVYPELRLSDIKPPADLGADEPFVAADLAQLDQVERTRCRRLAWRAGSMSLPHRISAA
jgi:uronate dehydrogenase